MEPTAYPLILTVDNRGHYPLYFRSADERAGITSDLTVGVTLYSVTYREGTTAELVPEGAPDQAPVLAEFGDYVDRTNFAGAMRDGCEIAAWYTPSQAGLGDKGTTRAARPADPAWTPESATQPDVLYPFSGRVTSRNRPGMILLDFPTIGCASAWGAHTGMLSQVTIAAGVHRLDMPVRVTLSTVLPEDDLMAGYAGDENEGEPDTTTG